MDTYVNEARKKYRKQANKQARKQTSKEANKQTNSANKLNERTITIKADTEKYERRN